VAFWNSMGYREQHGERQSIGKAGGPPLALIRLEKTFKHNLGCPHIVHMASGVADRYLADVEAAVAGSVAAEALRVHRCAARAALLTQIFQVLLTRDEVARVWTSGSVG
jgi:hypothetical protein